MLSKCANPHCPATFRYLHESRLHVICPNGALAGRKPRYSSKSRQLEYAWLCSSCAVSLTVQIDEDVGARVIAKFKPRNDSDFDTSASDGINFEIAY